MKPIAWIYQYCKKYIWAIALLAAAGMLSACGFILLAFVSSRLLDVVIGAIQGNAGVYCVLLAGIVLLQGALNIGYSNLRMYVLGKLEIAMRQGILETVLKKEYGRISTMHSGEVMNYFTSDVEVITQGVVGIIPQLLSMATRVFAGLWVLFAIDRAFAVGVLAVGLVIGLGSRIYSRHFQHLHKEVQETGGKVRSFMQECVENLLAVKSFSGGEVMQEKLDERQQEHYRMKMKRNAAGNFANTVAYLLFTGGYYAALAWGAFRIAEGVLTFGGLTAFLQILNQLRQPFRNMSGLIPQYYSMKSSAERIMELEALPEERVETQIVKPEEFYQHLESLVFEHVSFGYDRHPVLKDISFEVRKGELAVITGPSGRGKSTLFKLLLGLYPCGSGGIFVETDGGRVSVNADTRNLFAYVPQGNLILSGTIRDNLTFFHSRISEEQMIEAAKAACIWEYIQTLPEGLDTELKERGAGLSEGQIQRLAIARAICSDAPVLLLDECTSALDKATEQKVLKHLREMKTKTILFISHKKEALSEYDREIRL